MRDITYKSINTKYIAKAKDINIIARTISVYFILTICGLYIFPSGFTNLIKPLFIYILLLEFVILREKLKFKIEHRITLSLIFYFLLIFLKTGLNSANFKGVAPLLLNLTFFLLATSVEYNQKEINLLVNSLYWAGFIFAFIVAISNPIISNNISRMNVHYFNNSLNANGIPYLIVPSVVIGIKRLLNNKKHKINKLYILFSVFIMVYTIFYASTRGAILALLVSLSMLILKYLLDNLKDRKIITVSLFFIFIILSSYTTLYLLPENVINRVFNFSSYNLNSRDQLWRLAVAISKNNFYFGNGFNYWTQVTGRSYGSHNLYIDLLVSSGLFGSILMLSLVGIILFKSRNIFLLSLLTAPVMNSLFESGLTYDFWNPLILCVIVYSSPHYKSINFKVDKR